MRGEKNKKGFTLGELLVVILILSVLAGYIVPNLQKAKENALATDGLSGLVEVGNAQRMRAADGSDFVTGLLDNSCNAGACDTSPTSTQVCNLVRCKKLSTRGWDNAPWQQFACDLGGAGGGCCAAGLVGCARRRTGAAPGTNQVPYNQWGYTIDDKGILAATGSPPPPDP